MSPPPPDEDDAYVDWFLTSAFGAEDGDDDDGLKAPLEPDVLEEVAPERLGKYPVAERIGEGGIGLVYRVSDPELGRDLAIKVMRSAHAGNAELVARFVEEARICSRLQHPGVVPVHELGRLEDGRPYFTMKIIDGHTLARLLRDRGDSRRDLRRYLDILERVCATLAYAHSHGTTHGDLTPRNVMVGAFGEVQVMDWGFARTAESAAARASTREGSSGSRIVGTPAYLAPEQARGEREKVGPATDVFGLGAILCEILTGAPPYLGDTKADLLLRASKGWLDDARARLRACTADRALEDLCLRCLSPEIVDRPADGGVVARELREYLASLEERLRVVERERIEAVAVASQERRVRWLSISLGAAAFLAVVVPGAIHLRNVQARSVLRGETEASIARSMERATLLLADERLAATTDPAAFSEALRAAREAELLARLPAAAPESLGEARTLIAEIVQQRERAAIDERTAAMLQQLRLHFGDAQRTGGLDGRTWLLGADADGDWAEANPNGSPGPRMDHEMAPAGDGTVLLFGGATTRFGPLLNDTWSWNGSTWTRLAPETVPPARSGHAMCFDPVRGRVVMFSGNAGRNSVLYHADTWEWDGADWRLARPTHSPPRRDWAGMAFDPRRRVTILFGGRDSSHAPSGSYEPYDDTWAWDGVDWTRIETDSSPPARHGHRLVYDANLDALLLAGGQFPRAPGYDDTWVWLGNGWAEFRPTVGYAGRAFFAMAFDEARGRMVLHGGKDVTDAVLLTDTWEFDGETWIRVSTDGPSRAWIPAAYDSSRRAVLLQGGALSPHRFLNMGARFAAAFRDYGIDLERLDEAEAAARLNESAIRVDLIYSLDEWLMVGGSPPRADDTLVRRLSRVANLVDSNEWRRRVRDALAADDLDRLRAMASPTLDADLPAGSLDLLATALSIEGDHDTAIEVFREACLRDPGDFNVHLKLADLLEFTEPDAREEILRRLLVAVAVRPDSVLALTTLSRLLWEDGEPESAISYLRRAVTVEPDLPANWHQLGRFHRAQGDLPAARAALEQAVRRGEWSAEVDLAMVLQQLGLGDEAIAAARHAVAMSPGQGLGHLVLGAVLLQSGRIDEAVGALEEAVRRAPFDATAHHLLGRALLESGEVEEARNSLRRALEQTAGTTPEQVEACEALLAVVEARLRDEAEE